MRGSSISASAMLVSGPTGHERDLARMLHHHVHDELRRGPRVGLARRLGQIDAAQPVGAVHEVRRAVEDALQRLVRAVGHGNVVAPGEGQQAQRVLRRQVGVDVAKGRGQPDDLQLRRGQGKEDRHGVVDARVGVDDDLLRHSSP
jgi:hypothetical protein